MSQINLIKYENKYKKALIEFLAYYYSSRNYDEREKLFEWRYEDNPYTENPFIYLALDKEKIVGFRAFVIQKFIIKDKDFLLGIPADAVVHPKYRRQGIFNNLTKYAFKDLYENSDIKFIVSLSANKKAESGNIKLGFFPIGKRKYLFLVSPFRFFKTIIKNTILHKNYNISSLKENENIEITSKLRPNSMSDLINRSLGITEIRNIKDIAFYNWIFSNKSPYEYKFAYYFKENKLVAYICILKGSRFLYSLVEYAYTKNEYLAHLIKITSEKYSIPLLRLYTFTKSSDEINLFKNLRFQGEENIFLRILNKKDLIKIEDGLGMLIKPITHDNEGNFLIENKDTRVPDNWIIFSSDIH